MNVVTYVALLGSMFSQGSSISILPPPGGESVRHGGGTPPYNRRGAGCKWEEVREEFPKVRLSCQTTLGGPDDVPKSTLTEADPP